MASYPTKICPSGECGLRWDRFEPQALEAARELRLHLDVASAGWSSIRAVRRTPGAGARAAVAGHQELVPVLSPPPPAAETTNAATTVLVSVCCGFWALVNPCILIVSKDDSGWWVLYIRQAARTTVHLLKRSISAYMASLYIKAGDFDR